MANKKTYIITQNSVTLGLGKDMKTHEIGDEVKLSESQATNLAGKVRSKSEHVEESKGMKELKADNAKLVKQNEALTEQIGKLTDQLTAAK